MGILYENGTGVPKDAKSAIKWYKLAAKQGDANAPHNLGVMYRTGNGIPRNPQTALKWYRVATEYGSPHSAFALGLMHSKGDGIPQDYDKAVKWFRLGAEMGHIPCQFNLGKMYYFGDGIQKDYIRAHMWWDIVARSGDKAGIKTRDMVAKKMTPSQLEKAEKLARECILKKYGLLRKARVINKNQALWQCEFEWDRSTYCRFLSFGNKALSFTHYV